MKKYILGIKIDDVSLDEAVKVVEGWLKKGGKYYIVTTNPEFIMTAQEDQYFKKILNNADLSVPDGMGLKLSGDILNNSPGIDLVERLTKMASEKGLRVGFLGGGSGVAELCAERLRSRYPKLKVSFTVESLGVLLASRSGLACDLLFVAFGHPKQEKWVAENLPKIPVKIAMGVGGSFDYISGKVPRAPFWMRSLGMEWLFRLIVQPWRINRQMRLLKYVTLILWQRFLA